MDTLTEFLRNKDISGEDKCLELLRYFYAGYLTVSEYHNLISIYNLGDMNTMAAIEDRVTNNSDLLPTAKEEDQACLSGTKLRKFIFEIDEAKELVRGKNYFDVWKMRLDKPEGFAFRYVNEEDGVTEEDSWYVVKGYEEYGLNRINDNLVTRTTKKYVLSDTEDLEQLVNAQTAVVEDVVVIFPYMTEPELAELTSAYYSIDGGFSFTAIGQLMTLKDNMRVKYHCPARNAFVIRAFVAEDGTVVDATKDKGAETP